MTWEQKLMAFKALNPSTTVNMREPGNWYVGCGFEHADGTMMLRGDYGNGNSPETAVEAHAKLFMDGRPFHYRDNWYRWNGFMWESSSRP